MDRDSGFSGWEEKSSVQSEGALALVICISPPPLPRCGDSRRITDGERTQPR